MKKHWEPTSKQIEALERNEDEVLFGGARGGGKTDAGMAWLLYNKDHAKFRGLVIRRNADDLRDWIDRARDMFAPTKAVFIGQPVEIRFPSGAKIRTGHLKDDNAYGKYQGHEYQAILIEELAQIPKESMFEKLLGSCRSTIPELRPKFFGTTNPDGPGHYWVKDRYDCETPDKKPREFKDEETGITKTRIFIPSKVEDNPYLMKNDPGYVAFLNSIQDPVLRRQWREGSWEDPNVEGAYYAEWLRMARADNRITSVPHQSGFEVDTWWDIGVGDSTAIWFTQAVNKEVHVIDYVESEGEGLVYYAEQLKSRARNADKVNGYSYGTHYFPHDIQQREFSTGKSRLDKVRDLGITPHEIVPKLPIADGINAARDFFGRCWFDAERCKDGLNALKNYRKQYDEKRMIYKDKPLHDWSSHGADGFRYMAVGYDMFKVAKSKQVVYTKKREKYLYR